MCVHAVGPPTSAQGPAKFLSSNSCARGRNEDDDIERLRLPHDDRTQPHICQTRRTRRNRARTRRRRHRAYICHPGTDPAARTRGRRPHRAGPHRHGQDLCIRRAAAAAHHHRHRATADGHPARARRGAHPRTVPAGLRRPRRRREVPHRRRAASSSVASIYGGRPYEPQIEALRKGVDVVVGTPGRLLDLAQQGHLQLGGHRGAGARRGRRDARPGLPARHRAHPAPDPRRSGSRCCSRRPCRTRSSRWPAPS